MILFPPFHVNIHSTHSISTPLHSDLVIFFFCDYVFKLYCKKLFLFVLITFSRTAEISEAILLFKFGFVSLFPTQLSCSTCISFRLSSFLLTVFLHLYCFPDNTALVSFLVDVRHVRMQRSGTGYHSLAWTVSSILSP